MKNNILVEENLMKLITIIRGRLICQYQKILL
jgi:hypothetical protein